MDVELKLTKRQARKIGKGELVVIHRKETVYNIGLKTNETQKAKLLAQREKIEQKLAAIDGFKCDYTDAKGRCSHVSPSRSGLSIHKSIKHGGRKSNLPHLANRG